MALSDGFATGLGVAHLSLTHGWVPTILELVAAVTLVLVVGRRTRRWNVVWLPAGGIIGAGAAIGAYWYVRSAGLAGDPAPAAVWIWIGLSGLAAVIAAAGWRARWQSWVSLSTKPSRRPDTRTRPSSGSMPVRSSAG